MSSPRRQLLENFTEALRRYHDPEEVEGHEEVLAAEKAALDHPEITSVHLTAIRNEVWRNGFASTS